LTYDHLKVVRDFLGGDKSCHAVHHNANHIGYGFDYQEIASGDIKTDTSVMDLANITCLDKPPKCIEGWGSDSEIRLVLFISRSSACVKKGSDTLCPEIESLRSLIVWLPPVVKSNPRSTACAMYVISFEAL
jgi:hypothetical protein